MTQLATSPIGYGIPDFASGAFNDARRREELRAGDRGDDPPVRAALPVGARALDRRAGRLETTLRLRIEAVLHAEPAPEPMTFDTLVDPTTDESWCGPAMWSEWPGHCRPPLAGNGSGGAGGQEAPNVRSPA